MVLSEQKIFAGLGIKVISLENQLLSHVGNKGADRSAQEAV